MSATATLEARNRHAAFMRGYRHGAAGKATLAANHGWLADDYTAGYLAGVSDAGSASRAASDKYGYTPSILRVEGASS